MAANPDTRKLAATTCRLAPFHPGYADLVLSWIQDAQEAHWLAPRTPPPLSATKVLHWQAPGHQAFMLIEPGAPAPLGYGELNILNAAARRYWLGHLIVDPARRGRGLGVQLTRLLLWEAFCRQGAREVSLVVFPENRRAIVCYEAAGLRADGHELHDFPAYAQQVNLLRMVARGFV